MTSDDIQIQLPPMDVERAAPIMLHMTQALERLWAAGRFAALVATPEGSAAVAAFEVSRLEVQKQLNDAHVRKEPSASMRFSLPSATARLAVAFVERAVALMRDADAMAAVGGIALSEAEYKFFLPYFRHIEATVASG